MPDSFLPWFPSDGRGLQLDLPSAHQVPVEALSGDVSGVVLDPEGAVLILVDGRGTALRFGDRHDVLLLAASLLALHDEMARRASIAGDALAALQNLIDARATVSGSGNA